MRPTGANAGFRTGSLTLGSSEFQAELAPPRATPGLAVGADTAVTPLIGWGDRLLQVLPDKAVPVPVGYRPGWLPRRRSRPCQLAIVWADSNRSFRSCPPGPLTGNDLHPGQVRYRYRSWKGDLTLVKTPGSSRIQSRHTGAEVAARKSALTGFHRIAAVLHGRPGSSRRSWLRRRACPAVGQ